MKIKGFFHDISGATRVTKRREELFKTASSDLNTVDPIQETANLLHPGKLDFIVNNVEDVSPTARRYTLVPTKGWLPVFQAGQYLVLDLNIGKTRTSRPYSISSAPYEALGKKAFVQITVRKGHDDGFASNYIYNEVKKGMPLKAALPFGHFNYEELRDAKNVVGIAGGSGITPFLSFAKEIAHGTLHFDLTILYGSVHENDIILKDDLSQIVSPHVHFINVISGDPDYRGEKGFINRDIIKKYSHGDTSYFVCGPLPMYHFIEGELKALSVPPRRIRMEAFGAPRDISKCENYPSEMVDKVFKLTVVRGIQKDVIDAKASESIAVALERAGIPFETHCRSGACGYCRSELLSGNVFIPKEGDGRRMADKESHAVHACSTYPLSDITIKIPIR